MCTGAGSHTNFLCADIEAPGAVEASRFYNFFNDMHPRWSFFVAVFLLLALFLENATCTSGSSEEEDGDSGGHTPIDAFQDLSKLDKVASVVLFGEPFVTLQEHLLPFHKYILRPLQAILAFGYLFNLVFREILYRRNLPVTLVIFAIILLPLTLLFYRARCVSMEEDIKRDFIKYSLMLSRIVHNRLLNFIAIPEPEPFEELELFAYLRLFHTIFMLFLALKDFYNAFCCASLFQGASQLGDHIIIAIAVAFFIAYMPISAYAIAYVEMWKVFASFCILSPRSPFAVVLKQPAPPSRHPLLKNRGL
jgi:hypothetical protein